ncbi:5,6-dimethylbenzimidazole synthase [Sphingomonas sp. CFBP 13603]|uniref:5,6-dimethylbenzimidazole synthase n=1 Tax=Sphingomonas sp. CFBP 13603 TaxID=2774040 RepID=UPI001865C8B5|nr:5,6-dimethylbenzimidazole synthase [Sphingomonas sp. CFBP 13603]
MSAREADAPIFGPAFQAELDALFRWRRDVRRFRRDALPDGLIDRLLATANAAPSVGLSQPWRFVTVDDPARRVAVRADFEACNAAALATQDGTRVANYARLKLEGLEQAPCHVAVFVEPDPEQGHGLGRRTMPESVAYSAVIAVHTLWLAARAHGIGLGWVSILAPPRIRAILEIPETWQLVAYLCVGYPEIEAITPELEREGWEKRRSINIVVR